MAFDTLTSTLFQALEDVENFSYSSEELQELYDTVKPTKKSHKKPMKTSAYKMFQAENAGKPEKPIWKDIKEDPDKFKIYQDLACKKNEELGFSNEQDLKEQKKQKTKDKNEALKAAIAAAKKQKNEVSSSTEEADTSSPVIETTKSDTFDTIDENNDGVISREEFENYLEKSETHNSEDEVEVEVEGEVEGEVEVEVEVEDPIETDTDISSLPLFTGKAPKTALNNFKQWVLKQKNLEFNSSIKREDLNEYKEEYGFDKDKYDETCDWFEFIQNNMRTE